MCVYAEALQRITQINKWTKGNLFLAIVLDWSTFWGICARALAIMLLFSLVMFLIIDPRLKTTIPSSSELCTNSSISCRKKTEWTPRCWRAILSTAVSIVHIAGLVKNGMVLKTAHTFGKGLAGWQWIPPRNMKLGRIGRGKSKSQ